MRRFLGEFGSNKRDLHGNLLMSRSPRTKRRDIMKPEKKLFATITHALALVCVAVFSVNASAATTTYGTPLIVQTTGTVMAQFVGGASAGFTNHLYLDSPTNALGVIFNNHTSTLGDTVNLGSFTAGTELIFRNHVADTDTNFFTGPASRNPDNVIHAGIIEGLTDADMDAYEFLNGLPNGTLLRGGTLVGFEDTLGGGDLDYNDLSYLFTNVGTAPVPVPAAMWLFGSGLMGLIGTAARRNKKA
jgi:hypothetical protein